MKTIHYCKLLIIAIITIMPMSNLVSQTKSTHKGTFKRAKGYKFEIVTKENKIYFFVYDKKRNPLPNTEIMGTASILLPNGETKQVELIKSDTDGFMINEANVTNYSHIKATFKIEEKSISITFYKERKLEHFKEDKTKYYHEQGTLNNYN